MTSIISTSAPAGVLGRDSAVANPYAGAAAAAGRSAVAPRVAARGARVPTVRLRDGIAGVTGTPRGEFTVRFHAQSEPQKNTTLGSHPSSRPQS